MLWGCPRAGWMGPRRRGRVVGGRPAAGGCGWVGVTGLFRLEPCCDRTRSERAGNAFLDQLGGFVFHWTLRKAPCPQDTAG